MMKKQLNVSRRDFAKWLLAVPAVALVVPSLASKFLGQKIINLPAGEHLTDKIFWEPTTVIMNGGGSMIYNCSWSEGGAMGMDAIECQGKGMNYIENVVIMGGTGGVKIGDLSAAEPDAVIYIESGIHS